MASSGSGRYRGAKIESLLKDSFTIKPFRNFQLGKNTSEGSSRYRATESGLSFLLIDRKRRREERALMMSNSHLIAFCIIQWTLKSRTNLNIIEFLALDLIFRRESPHPSRGRCAVGVRSLLTQAEGGARSVCGRSSPLATPSPQFHSN